jgi:hypothetical protein
MATLSKQERQVLYLARSLIRDLGHDWSPSETGVESFADVCAQLSNMLDEEYDYEAGDVTKEATAPIGPRTYRVAAGVVTADLENTLNAFAEAGYQVSKQTLMQDGSWVVSAFDPMLLSQKAGQLMANQVADMMNRAGLGLPKTT